MAQILLFQQSHRQVVAAGVRVAPQKMVSQVDRAVEQVGNLHHQQVVQEPLIKVMQVEMSLLLIQMLVGVAAAQERLAHKAAAWVLPIMAVLAVLV